MALVKDTLAFRKSLVIGPNNPLVPLPTRFFWETQPSK